MSTGRGCLSDIQRFSVHDGPGIRTLFFFKGCPLSCKWCQNPETQRRKPEIKFDSYKCIGCGECLQACEYGLDRKLCTACGRCAKVCCSGARELAGKEYTAEELVQIALKDKVFYEKSGGGVTASGGEPLYQWPFLIAFFQKLKAKGIHTAVETCGYGPETAIQELCNYTDLFLYDIKLITEEAHKKWTGRSNRIILQNAEKIKDQRKNIILRIPLIPGVNDGEEFEKIARFAKSLDKNQEIHILPFHQLGASKYDALCMEYELRDKAEADHQIIASCVQTAETMGLKVNVGGTGFAGQEK